MLDQLKAMQLVRLANLENWKRLFMEDWLELPERLQKLNRIAIEQMEILTSEHSRRVLSGGVRDDVLKNLRNDPTPPQFAGVQ